MTARGACRRSGRARWVAALASACVASACASEAAPWPAGFVDAAQAVPGLVVEARYAGADNFIGRPIAGYGAARCVLTVQAASALAAVQQELQAFGLGLKVFDCYRPQRAVDDFVRWAQDLQDQQRKAEHYPRVDKRDLFKEGYIAQRSGHSRGSTVDLTLVARGNGAESGPELDMGGRFDLFDISSAGASPQPTPTQRANRLLLRTLMKAHGFRPYAAEWWHFTLVGEPHPETWFDFEVR
jgi:D-alanyl-D-alanine dipeptidase